MVCLGSKPGATGWYAQTKPRSYGGRQMIKYLLININSLQLDNYISFKIESITGDFTI